MPPTSPSEGTGRNPVERLAEEFVERQRRGEHPSLSEYTSKYPELADEIRYLFRGLMMMEKLKPAAVSEGEGDGGDVGVGDDRTSSVAADPGAASGGFGPSSGRLGDYRILREVGRGGMGVVYEAVQESLGRHVALKILPVGGRLGPAQVARFELEARSAARLHHGNIVPVYGVGEHQGVRFYAMQFIQGHGLDTILADLRRLRGLDPAPAAASASGGDAPPPTAGDAGSLAMARSLLTGGFVLAEPSAAASAPEPTLAATGSETNALAPGTEKGAVGRNAIPPHNDPASVTAVHPVGRNAIPSHSLAQTDTSALSLATDSHFYRSVARVGRQVADALAYAHQQGVLHRDIKPSNLLLDAAGNVWVTDFGLAKVEGSDGPTRTGDIVGTIRYMAPERFDGWSDRRSDVYSLGATLYELLTLRPLFGGAVQAELIEKVLHDAPDSPRKLDSKVPRDVETIVLKALAKEPGDRYPTAEAVGDDLRRFLEDRPVLARRSTPVERFWRWCRRNPWLAAANITAAAVTTILAIVSTVAALSYRDQRNQIGRNLKAIQVAQTKERENFFESLVSQAQARRVSRREGQRFKTLDALAKAAEIARELKLPPERLEPLRDEAIACLALPDLKPTGRVMQRPHGTVKVAFDSTLTRYALRFRDGTIQVRRVADDEVIARFQARGDREFILHFSPDGRYLASSDFPQEAVTVWDVGHCTIALKLPGHRDARFSPDSRRIVEIYAGKARVYDLATGRTLRSWRATVSQGTGVFGPDGAQIAVIGDRTCRILDAETGRLVRSITLPTIQNGVAWSPDATTLATWADDDRRINLWDAATGIRRATLERHTQEGLWAAFHPAGELLASHGWEGRMWLWDPVLGRPWLNLVGTPRWELSQDGQIFIDVGERMTPYQVDPVHEYRTFAHVSSEPVGYGRPSIRHGGRVMAVGTNRGVALWDLARGVELGFLPIGFAPHSIFEASGSLLTSTSSGVQRWQVRLHPNRGEFRIGPPQQLPLPAGPEGIDADRSGRIVALADYRLAFVATPERAIHIGPLDDCRFVAVSLDREWLATGSHGKNGVQLWRLRDAKQVAQLNIQGLGTAAFSPDSKWLMTASAPCRLWAVGTWHEARQIGGEGVCFSPDSRLVVVQDAIKVLRLAETETGRTLAHLESPDLCHVGFRSGTFTPDGSRLVVTTGDGPAVHVWDLRAIRRHLASMGLDWDAPAFSDDDPASPTLPPLPPLEIDYGPSALTGHLDPKVYEPLIADLETGLVRDPEQRQIRGMLAHYCNDYAWRLATAPKSARDPQCALSLARRAVELAPSQGIYLNTLGIAEYRAGQYADAIATLQRSLTANRGEFAAFDLFPLAMAHHRLGHGKAARDCFARGVSWLSQQKSLSEQYTRELAAFRAEAEAVLAGPGGELPADVFAGPL
jgi:serine/threonine protein kinase/WD40 repeat protein